MVLQPLFILRQSPDWNGLAADFGMGRQIDPARYLPAEGIPGFPEDIGYLIRQWNDAMGVDFFSVRARLKEISDKTIAKIDGARSVSYLDASSLERKSIENCVVFYHDDDDWFSPDIAATVESLTDHFDVCVFPLILIRDDPRTYTRGQNPTQVLGRRRGFTHRYQSNNYGINGKICDGLTLLNMKDHVQGSEFANNSGLRDVYVDRIVSATVKSPCSATNLEQIFDVSGKPRNRVRRYVAGLEEISVPPDLVWMSSALESLAELFSDATRPRKVSTFGKGVEFDQAGTRPRHDGVRYLEFLKHIEKELSPSSYLEIGTAGGRSVMQIQCDAICVDPDLSNVGNIVKSRRRTLLFQMKSDEFFAEYDVKSFFPDGVDLAFLDGMHLFEFLLRDFINTERHCRPNSVILLHDCLPIDESITRRTPKSGAWAGDVWKILPILKKFRPDVEATFFDCPPTGLVACTHLNPNSSVLSEKYSEIVAEYLDAVYAESDLLSLYPRRDSRWLHDHPGSLRRKLAHFPPVGERA